jgi:hypothetical protein
MKPLTSKVSTERSPDTKKSSESSEELLTEDKTRVSRCARLGRTNKTHTHTRTHKNASRFTYLKTSTGGLLKIQRTYRCERRRNRLFFLIPSSSLTRTPTPVPSTNKSASSRFLLPPSGKSKPNLRLLLPVLEIRIPWTNSSENPCDRDRERQEKRQQCNHREQDTCRNPNFENPNFWIHTKELQ